MHIDIKQITYSQTSPQENSKLFISCILLCIGEHIIVNPLTC
jgi:hypothetical protein